jgi:cell division protein ZapA
MPEVTIEIGGRRFEVACQDGEEHYLHAAARLLDVEATHLGEQLGRLPESRMLLMAGLMLADKTAGMEDELKALREKVAALESTPPPEPRRVEVPVVPAGLTDSLAELAARAEALADRAEERRAQ